MDGGQKTLTAYFNVRKRCDEGHAIKKILGGEAIDHVKASLRPDMQRVKSTFQSKHGGKFLLSGLFVMT